METDFEKVSESSMKRARELASSGITRYSVETLAYLLERRKRKAEEEYRRMMYPTEEEELEDAKRDNYRSDVDCDRREYAEAMMGFGEWWYGN